MNYTFTSTYNMEQIKAETAKIDHAGALRKSIALMRLNRMRNGRVWRESFSSPAEPS